MMNICRGCASLDGAQAGDGLDYDDFKSAGESGDADAHAGRRRPFGIVHIGMQAIKINPGNKQISGWCKQWSEDCLHTLNSWSSRAATKDSRSL